MSRTIVIVASGMRKQNLRLQPWRYLLELGQAFTSAKDCKVILLTDGANECTEDTWDNKLLLVQTCHLSVFSQKKLFALIEAYKPTQVWWSLTPRSLAYTWIFRKLRCEKFGLVTCPLYSYGELLRASLHGVPYSELKALWQQRLIPRGMFARLLSGGAFRKTFVQSHANLDVIRKAGVPEVKLGLLRVGIDPEDCPDELHKSHSRDETNITQPTITTEFLYFGAPKVIRGFAALLEAFALACTQGMRANLVILARGADESEMTEIKQRLSDLGIKDLVTLKGGWLTREEVRWHISRCDLAVLPFIVVPSDVPIAILEAMAHGKPVVASAVDGIPELVDGRGKVVNPLNIKSFAEELKRLAQDHEQIRRLGSNAAAYMCDYPNWKDIAAYVRQEAGLA